MGFITGWLYCFFWYSSILAGYAGLFCPLLPLLFLSNKLYRQCTDALFTFWQYYPTVLLETLCSCEMQITGDTIMTDETSLIVMNHRTRTDWNFLWPTMYHCVNGKNRFRHPTKFVLKDIIRHIPGPGWVMQLACFIYIKRCWNVDQFTFKKIIDYFADLSYKYSLVVFPEGTDFTPSTKAKSDQYALRRGIQTYDYVLHPKTTGFVFLAQQMLRRQALDAVYDITLVYPDLVPQNELVLLRGGFPKRIKIHLTRYPISVLPRTDEGLRSFLEKRWLEKELILREYHHTKQFLHGPIIKIKRKRELIFALIFWSILPALVLGGLCFSAWFRLLVLGHTVFLIMVNLSSNGFQNFEIAVHNLRRKLINII